MPDWLALTAAQVQPEEAFFNVSFWRQLVGVFLGAALALGGAFGLRAWFDDRFKRRTAQIARDTLVPLLLDRLRILDHMDVLTRQHLAHPSFPPAMAVSHGRPAPATLLQFVLPEIGRALTHGEHMELRGAISSRERVDARYEAWVHAVTSAFSAATEVLDDASSTPKPNWQLQSEMLLTEIEESRSRLVCLVIILCSNASAPMFDFEAQAVKASLHPITSHDKKWTNFSAAGKSSILQQHLGGDFPEHFVAWEHDWPECPSNVIEIRSLLREHPPAPARAAALPTDGDGSPDLA